MLSRPGCARYTPSHPFRPYSSPTSRPRYYTTTAMAAPAPSQRWLDRSPALHTLSQSSPGFRGLLALQDAAIATLGQELDLHPAAPNAVKCAPLDADGAWYCASPDGHGAAAAAGLTGAHVRWVTPSAVGNAAMGFGSIRLLGWGQAHHAAPHLFFNATAAGDTVSTNLAYWPRADHTVDKAYYDFYYRAHLAGMASFVETGQHLAANPHFTVYEATMRGGVHTQLNFQFAPTTENFRMYAAALKQLVIQWAGFQLQASSKPDTLPGAPPEVVVAKDAYYNQCIGSGSGNAISVKLFGKEATDALIGVATGGAVCEYTPEEDH